MRVIKPCRIFNTNWRDQKKGTTNGSIGSIDSIVVPFRDYLIGCIGSIDSIVVPFWDYLIGSTGSIDSI